MELTVAMALQAVTQPGWQSGATKAASAGIGPDPRPTAPCAQRVAAHQPDRAGSATEREVSTRTRPAPRDWPESELLSRLLDGDNGAWEEFDRRYSRLIQSCIRRATAQFPAVGPDDTQEIEAMLWVQLLANDRRKLRGFEPERGCALSTWIGMLAIHCAYDYLRTLRREPVRVALADAERLSSELPDPADLCSAREHAARLEAALGCFSARDQEFVRLYFGEGLEAEQVAGQMGISVKTVYSKKHKIRQRLEMAMAQGRLAA
jgi:RNA polymerase sigma-70 factor, ECF subfamily